MFSESHNDRYRRIGDHTATNSLRDRDNVAGISYNSTEIGDNSAEIGDDYAGLSISLRKWSHAKLCPEWRLE